MSESVKRLGIVARADDGGLGNQTRALVEHLGPDAVLTVLLGQNARGNESWTRVTNRRGPLDAVHAVNEGPRLFEHNITFMLEHCDVLYTVEGPYYGDGSDLFARCERADVELVIHANPELYKNFPCRRLLVPTSWRLDQMPGSAQLVPHPVDIDRLPVFPRRDETPTFVHLTGPAMLDRQGTELVMAALPLVRHECFVWIRRDEQHLAQDQIGNVTVGWLPPAREYWEVIPRGCWALLQPRRYGGLSLCIQEAAARGMFTISLDRDPESSFYADVTLRCAVTDEQPYPMAGGEVGVADTNPAFLAAAIDEFIDQEYTTGINWERPRQWAERHSWETLRPTYEAILR